MWGSKLATWTKKVKRAGSMKWHLVYEPSLEERVDSIGVYIKEDVIRTFGYLDCGRKGPQEWWNDRYKIPLILKDTIDLNQANVCTYCKKARMKELGIKSKVMG